jgi:CheY-like chemotaxis protein
MYAFIKGKVVEITPAYVIVENNNIGYNVNIFLDSTDAYEFIRRNKDQCDLLITDLTMPNMTGDKLAEEIFYNIKKIPIILCSGYNENIDEKSMEKALQLI